MKILVGYNGSKGSIAAMKLAQKQAEAFNAQIIVAKIIGQTHELAYPDIAKIEDDLKKEARSIFDDDDLPYETHVIPTKKNAGEELAEYAQYFNANMIIIGIKKRSKVGKTLLGSDAQDVILNALCPVITAH
jgi:nucleotide-binding universal stress UspA family protein